MTSTYFRIGDRVRIDDRGERCHHRVPAYAKGHIGVVERVCQAYGRPENLAYSDHKGRPTTLYRVRIRQAAIWPDYDGSPHDTLDIEIFEHWLLPAAESRDQRDCSAA